MFFQCHWCLFPFPVWRLMAGLPGFASHGRAVFILELAANSESSWMSQALNLHLAMQLLIIIIITTTCHINISAQILLLQEKKKD